MSLFDRRVSLRITREGDFSLAAAPLTEAFVNTVITDDLLIEDLNVEFDVQRTNKKDPNNLLAKIYNLSEDSRNSISVGQRVVLNAGYKDQVSTIFVGDLRTVKHYRSGANLVSEISAGDGEKAQKKRFNKNYGKNTAFLDVAKDIAGFLEVGIGNLEEAINTQPNEDGGIPTTFKSGIAISGFAINTLDRLLDSRGLEYSIQDNNIQVLKIGEPLQDQVINLKADSGMIGIPTVTEKGILTCETLMIPGIFPGKKINLTTNYAANGDYTVLTGLYHGSLFSKDFGITIEAKII